MSKFTDGLRTFVKRLGADGFPTALVERVEQMEPLIVEYQKQAEPDANCMTLPNGDCVSTKDCMHGPGLKSAVSADAVGVCQYCKGSGQQIDSICAVCEGSGYPTWSIEHRDHPFRNGVQSE